MTDSVPKIIVIPAKAETPQEQEKKRNLNLPGRLGDRTEHKGGVNKWYS